MRVDLHTHSQASPDGGLTLRDYERALESGALDSIAITDHNTIACALEAKRQFGDRIIVGEEIMTTEGEIIGLFLKQTVEPLQSPEKTIQAIRSQGGLVYVPHPFETRRKGLPLDTMNRIVADIDIIEVYNGRVMQPSRRVQAIEWAKAHSKAGAASSDAHGRHGWSRTYTEVAELPTRQNLVSQFHNARLTRKDVGIIGRMYPSIHRTKRKFHKHA